VNYTNIFEDEILIKNKFIKNVNKFKSDYEKKEVLLGSTSVKSNHLNFFNFENKDQIKRIVDHEVSQLYVNFPRAAEILIEWIVDYYCFNDKFFTSDKTKNFIKNKMMQYENKVSRFKKSDNVNFLFESNDSKSNRIFRKVIEESDADDVIFVERSNKCETVIKKINQVNFTIQFDQDFLLGRSSISLDDYNYIIIDGYIDKISEIFHLLEEANKSKES
jgi:hypothetical protein